MAASWWLWGVGEPFVLFLAWGAWAGHFVGGWRIDGFGALFCWVYGLSEGGD